MILYQQKFFVNGTRIGGVLNLLLSHFSVAKSCEMDIFIFLQNLIVKNILKIGSHLLKLC